MPNRFSMPPVYLQSGDPEQESTAALHAPGLLGARFTVIQPSRGTPTSGGEDYVSKRYQLIKTDSSLATVPFKGAVAWWSDRSQYLVTTSPTNRRGQVAGVFQRAWERAGDYMCIQIGGPATVKFVDAPTAVPTVDGLFVIPSATAAKADCLAAGTAPTYPVLGRSMSALNLGDNTAIVDLTVSETT